MKYILTIVAVLGLALSGAYAGCGKKVTVTGKLSYDKDTKALVVAGTKKPIALTPDTAITGADGKKAEIADLDGKKVVVVHEHNKADSVKVAAKKKKA